MKTFPMFLTVAGRAIVIVGGGEQAAQKARLALKTEAELRLIAREFCPELADLLASGQAREFYAADAALFEDATLVFVATGCKGSDAAWHARAKTAGALVNVVDYPGLCDAMTRAIVDRDPVVVAIGTEGTAPLLGRQIKTQIEEMLHHRLGAFAALAGQLRSEVAFRLAAKDRRSFWRWFFKGTPWQLFKTGSEAQAEQTVEAVLHSGCQKKSGGLTVVLGATEAELLPLAAVQRMQEADILYLDRGLPESLLELARRDAERIFVKPSKRTQTACAFAWQLANNVKSRSVAYLTGQHDVLHLPEAVQAEHLVAARRAVRNPQLSLAATA
ncbi:MAG: NAD(P)-dependent oxidoreductase [Pseudomonadota bacterium]